MSSPSSSPEPRSPTEWKPWNFTQDRLVLHLRDHDGESWADIATAMDRSISACQQHYYGLKQATEGSFVDWTPELDHHIIEGRRRGLAIREISAEVGLTGHAVANRWHHLQRQHLVPEDVLAIWRRKEKVIWTTEEDEALLKLWTAGNDDDEIVRLVKFKNKSQDDVRTRRSQLVNGHSPLYLKILGLGDGKENVKTGLEKALGKKRYSWM